MAKKSRVSKKERQRGVGSKLLEHVMNEDDDRSTLSAKSLSKKHSRNYLNLSSRLLIIAAVVVLLVGVGISLKQMHDNNEAIAKAKAAVTAANHGLPSPAPSTIKPTESEYESYTVAPDMPRYLIIPKLSVKAIIRRVGLTSGGAIGTPTNVFDTAWYDGSARPGTPGASVIDGHVSSWTSDGVFYNLKTLKAGDMVQVVRGDGTVINYKVIKNVIYSSNNVDMSAVLSPIVTSEPGLNLITCTGDVIKGTNEFNARDVVFTEQV